MPCSYFWSIRVTATLLLASTRGRISKQFGVEVAFHPYTSGSTEFGVRLTLWDNSALAERLVEAGYTTRYVPVRA